MRMSQGVEWAIHCAVALSYIDRGRKGSRQRLAEYYGLPEAYLAKHLKSLVRAGVLDASTGPGGGFRLARDPEEISVLDIVEAIEGDQPAFVCTEIRQQGVCATPKEVCVRACPVAKAMHSADRVWRDTLRGISIGDLARSVPRDSRDRTRTWMSGSPVTPPG